MLNYIGEKRQPGNFDSGFPDFFYHKQKTNPIGLCYSLQFEKPTIFEKKSAHQ